MTNCICEHCVNLKDIRLENGEAATSCAFGAPTELCADCEAEGCSASCEFYQAIDAVNDPELKTVSCSICGKELQLIGDDNEEGIVFCVTCYLARENEADEPQ